MSETMSGLRHKISSATDLLSVVRSMKALAASNIDQYEKSVLALVDYNRMVESGLSVCFRNTSKSFTATKKPGVTQKQKEAMPLVAIVFGSDQGLVGRFNDSVSDFAVKTLAGIPGDHKIWAIGERVQSRLLDAGLSLAGHFPVPNSVQAITPLVAQILFECESGNNKGNDQDEFTEFYLFYNHPELAAVYKPVQQRLLPLDESWCHRLTELPWPTNNLPEVMGDNAGTLRALIREYIFVSIFRACAESLASENASRLAAMQRADKNIDEMLEDLNAAFHRLRQSSIDEELFDVISGYEALST